MSDAPTSAAALARATPDARDRYVDLLRVGSLAVVILGHWLMAVLAVSAVGFGGALAGRHATLVVLPVTPLWSAVLLAAGGLLLVASRPRQGRGA